MAYAEYHFTLKSKELRGAGQPNILQIGLDSDDDITPMKTNLEALFNATVVSVDKLISSNYAQPYPDGTNKMYRGAMWDDAGQEGQIIIKDVLVADTPGTLETGLIAAGLKFLANGVEVVPTSINLYRITPGKFRP